MESITKPVNVAIIGASGGIGQAIVEQLGTDTDTATLFAFSRDARVAGERKIKRFPIDILDEQSIARAAEFVAAECALDLVIVASGILHRDPAVLPEKTMGMLTASAMSEVLHVNTIGPALVARHFLPLMRKSEKTVFAALSARVGSISDNRLGGWVSYRASKAALNMVMKTFAIEQARRFPQSIVVSLHPGTVDTALSQPFSGAVAEQSLFTPVDAAARLLQVVDGLDISDNGGFFAWDGSRIEF